MTRVPASDPPAGGEAPRELRAGADLDAVPDGAVAAMRAPRRSRARPRTLLKMSPSGKSRRRGPAGRRRTSRRPPGRAPPRRALRASRGGNREGCPRSLERRPRAASQPISSSRLSSRSGCPEIRDERRLPGRDPSRAARGAGRRRRCTERTGSTDEPRSSESRDAVPFGLKRRVPVGIPDSRRRGASPARPVSRWRGEKRRDSRARSPRPC